MLHDAITAARPFDSSEPGLERVLLKASDQFLGRPLAILRCTKWTERLRVEAQRRRKPETQLTFTTKELSRLTRIIPQPQCRLKHLPVAITTWQMATIGAVVPNAVTTVTKNFFAITTRAFGSKKTPSESPR